MRTTIFLVGIVMIIAGPLLTLLSLASCFGTILSGQFLACVTDFVFVAFGGVLFFVGLIVAIVGGVTSEAPPPILYRAPSIQPQPAEITCKKCGRVYESTRFFCPSCGQRPY